MCTARLFRRRLTSPSFLSREGGALEASMLPSAGLLIDLYRTPGHSKDPVAKAILVFSQKGGWGKTTTAVNFAAVLAFCCHRTLLVDCDPQGAATCSSGSIHSKPEFSLAGILYARTGIERCMFQSRPPNLEVVRGPFEPTIEQRGCSAGIAIT
jgi:hypothetical protein